MSRSLGKVDIGIEVGDTKINSLLYADDLILLASTKEQLQTLCDYTQAWAKDYKLTVNPDKTEYVVFNGRARGTIELGNCTIEA